MFLLKGFFLPPRATLVGVTRQTISMIKSDKYNPSLNRCITICKALNKTLNDLFWREVKSIIVQFYSKNIPIPILELLQKEIQLGSVTHQLILQASECL